MGFLVMCYQSSKFKIQSFGIWPLMVWTQVLVTETFNLFRSFFLIFYLYSILFQILKIKLYLKLLFSSNLLHPLIFLSTLACRVLDKYHSDSSALHFFFQKICPRFIGSLDLLSKLAIICWREAEQRAYQCFNQKVFPFSNSFPSQNMQKISKWPSIISVIKSK